MRLGREPVHQQIEDLCLELALLIERTVHGAMEEGPAGVLAMEALLPEDALWRLRPQFDAAFVDYLEHQRQTKSFRPDDPFVGLYFTLLRFLNGLLAADGAFSKCVELRGGEARLRVFCRDPSRFLGGVIGRAHSVIGLSATLSPNAFLPRPAGLRRARHDGASRCPIPFPATNRRVVGRLDRHHHLARAAAARGAHRRTPRRVHRRRAGATAWRSFPSYDFLAQVAEQLKPRHKRVLVQRRADNDAARDAILETLRTALLGDVLLLAVAGGVFAEGVDYPGEMLRAVAVVGPCLPGISLEIEL
jgi:DNA excision repair protein ERCC-2